MRRVDIGLTGSMHTRNGLARDLAHSFEHVLIVLLDLRLECKWVAAPDGFPGRLDLFLIAYVVLTILAHTRLVAETA